jgi:geranylgeranyl diphosphate synthase, type II
MSELDLGIEVNDLNNEFFILTPRDFVYIFIIVILVFLLLFSNTPTVVSTIDSIQSYLVDNIVTKYIMNGVSQTHYLTKKNEELTKALKTLETPMQTSSELAALKKQIDVDLENIINEEISNEILRKASLDAIAGGKRLRPIIAYSIVNRLRKIYPDNKDGILRRYDIKNLNAIELLHSSSLIIDDIMDQDDYRRNKLAAHKAYELNIALMTSSQLTVTAYKLVSRVDRQTKDHMIEGLVEERIDAKEKNLSKEEMIQNSEYYNTHALLATIIDDTSDLIDGQVLDLYGSNDTREMVLESIKKKTASIYTMIFEMAWVVGGGSISRKYIQLVRETSEDFGVLYQIYDDFTDYYSDQIDQGDNANYVLSIGIDEAHDEFHHRVKSFTNKAKQLDISTSAIKNIVKYLSDCVDLSHSMISDDNPKK